VVEMHSVTDEYTILFVRFGDDVIWERYFGAPNDPSPFEVAAILNSLLTSLKRNLVFDKKPDLEVVQ
jgi:hypothetical protein